MLTGLSKEAQPPTEKEKAMRDFTVGAAIKFEYEGIEFLITEWSALDGSYDGFVCFYYY